MGTTVASIAPLGEARRACHSSPRGGSVVRPVAVSASSTSAGSLSIRSRNAWRMVWSCCAGSPVRWAVASSTLRSRYPLASTSPARSRSRAVRGASSAAALGAEGVGRTAGTPNGRPVSARCPLLVSGAGCASGGPFLPIWSIPMAVSPTTLLARLPGYPLLPSLPCQSAPRQDKLLRGLPAPAVGCPYPPPGGRHRPHGVGPACTPGVVVEE